MTNEFGNTYKYEILLEIGFNIRLRYYSADVARRCGRGIMLGREYISLRIILYEHVYNSTIIRCCNGFYILSSAYIPCISPTQSRLLLQLQSHRNVDVDDSITGRVQTPFGPELTRAVQHNITSIPIQYIICIMYILYIIITYRTYRKYVQGDYILSLQQGEIYQNILILRTNTNKMTHGQFQNNT